VRTRLRQDLTIALKARDRVAIAALRSTIAAIENAESVDAASANSSTADSEHIAGATAGVGSSDVPRRLLSENDVIAVVRGQIEERLQAADQYEQLGKVGEAARLRGEAVVLREYLLA
jgi:uncharacterized protein